MGVRTGGIKKSELGKLFHIDEENLAGRVVPLIPVYDEDYQGDEYREDWEWPHWYLWVENSGELTRLQGEPLKGRYFAKEMVSDDDIYVPFLDFYNQHLSWAEVMGTISRIETDLRNLAACMSKIATYQQLTENSVYDPQPFVVTELEYIFSVCRSLYDLLQNLAWRTWNGVKLEDGGWNELQRKSFARMALSGDDPIPAEELIEKYGLPDPLGEFYESEAEFFSTIRDFRDDVIHHGESIDLVYDTEDGFAVPSDLHPFDEFDVWDPDDFLENDLAPLWPSVAHVIGHTLGALDRFTRAFAKDMGFLTHIAPDHKVYLRGEYVTNLQFLNSLVEDDVWGKKLIVDRGIDLPNGD